MHLRLFGLAVVPVLLLGGCSADVWQRTGFETFQNLRWQECGAEPGEPCPERQRYEHYQRSRPA